jgi:hypothetical protein
MPNMTSLISVSNKGSHFSFSLSHVTIFLQIVHQFKNIVGDNKIPFLQITNIEPIWPKFYKLSYLCQLNNIQYIGTKFWHMIDIDDIPMSIGNITLRNNIQRKIIKNKDFHPTM